MVPQHEDCQARHIGAHFPAPLLTDYWASYVGRSLSFSEHQCLRMTKHLLLMVESSGLRYKIAFPIPQLFVTAGGSQQAELFLKTLSCQWMEFQLFTLKRLHSRPSRYLLSRVFLPQIFFLRCLFSSAGPLLGFWGHTGWHVRVAQGFLPTTCLGVTSNSVGGPRAGVGRQPGLQVLHPFELLLQVLGSRKIPTEWDLENMQVIFVQS